jgi:Tfp pilus assembly protein PilV
MNSTKIAPDQKQLGQTLIETLVAIFILIFGLVTALGLAIYSFNSTDNSSREIVGTALAREGIEGFKNARDTNWLVYPASNCSFQSLTQPCHVGWLTSTASRNMQQGNYAIDYGADTGLVTSVNNPASYVLNYNSVTRRYGSAANAAPGTASIYSRKVNITYNTDPTMGYDVYPEVIVTSTVWWAGRTCPATNDPTTLSSSCKVILIMHLTNWKNY